MTEPCELAADTPVSPVGVLVGEADDQTPEFGVDRWASAFGRGRLGQVPCDESTMPSKHRLRSDNQERRRAARAIHRAAEEGKHRAVGFVESRLVDLALQHEELVAERKDLSVARVAGGEYPADSSENEACERGKQVHNSSTIPISKLTRNPLNRWSDDFSAPSGSLRGAQPMPAPPVHDAEVSVHGRRPRTHALNRRPTTPAQGFTRSNFQVGGSHDITWTR